MTLPNWEFSKMDEFVMHFFRYLVLKVLLPKKECICLLENCYGYDQLVTALRARVVQFGQ